MTWRYTIVMEEEGYYTVGEQYSGLTGYVPQVVPCGETPEELIQELEMMLQDCRKALKEGTIIDES